MYFSLSSSRVLIWLVCSPDSGREGGRGAREKGRGKRERERKERKRRGRKKVKEERIE